MKRRVLVAMSGGVDSSVAAALLLEQGHEVAGATMKLFDDEAGGGAVSRACCSADDVDDARDVCRKLGIEHFVFNFTEDFRRLVVNKFTNEYLCNLTPNPCLDCNRFMKFEKFAERARLLGFDAVSTGHYARVHNYTLLKGADASKDQSYALYAAKREQLRDLLLPVGEFRKNEVRELAKRYNLPVFDKPDSQDICFVRGRTYAEFIAEKTGILPKEGDFLDMEGRVIGRHDGAIHFTVGQRRGINFSSTAVGATERMYVVDKNMNKNTVTLGFERDLYTQTFRVGDLNLFVDSLREPTRLAVKIRYNGREFSAVVWQTGENRATVTFDEPQRAVTAGQAAVFYDGDAVVGGGVILPNGG